MDEKRHITREIKNLIHNKYKITKEDVIQMIKEAMIPMLKGRVDWFLRTRIDEIITDYSIKRALMAIVKEEIKNVEGNLNFYEDRANFVNKLIFEGVRNRANEILKDQITEKMIYEILKEKFRINEE